MWVWYKLNDLEIAKVEIEEIADFDDLKVAIMREMSSMFVGIHKSQMKIKGPRNEVMNASAQVYLTKSGTGEHPFVVEAPTGILTDRILSISSVMILLEL